jgi:hypothetical protein
MNTNGVNIVIYISKVMVFLSKLPFTIIPYLTYPILLESSHSLGSPFLCFEKKLILI